MDKEPERYETYTKKKDGYWNSEPVFWTEELGWYQKIFSDPLGTFQLTERQAVDILSQDGKEWRAAARIVSRHSVSLNQKGRRNYRSLSI